MLGILFSSSNSPYSGVYPDNDVASAERPDSLFVLSSLYELAKHTAFDSAQEAFPFTSMLW